MHPGPFLFCLKVRFTSYDDLFGLGNSESSIEIDINQIRSFKDHPFKVLEDEKMAELVQSIEMNGVLTPVIVRGKNTTKVRNIKGYLMAALFNAGSTMGSYYKAEVNHDMPQFAG